MTVVIRERAGTRPECLCRGAREGAPAARQVADRWHLLRNCSDALLNVVERRYRVVREVGKSIALQGPTPANCISGGLHLKKAARHQIERRQSRRAVFEKVIELRHLGWSRLAIQRELGVDLKTIRKWLKNEAPGSWQRTVYKANAADAFEAYLRRRGHEGCRNAMPQHRREAGHATYAAPQQRDGPAASRC
ncbi:chorismate mutase [Sphingobium sp. JAI105]|nr:chorismate mutase [Sphingobium sp. JAI105]